jgi:hypothetical protein
MLPAFAGCEFLDGSASHDFVEGRAFASTLAEDTPQALNVFANAASPREDDGDVGLGDVDAFIQNTGGGHNRISAIVETFEDLASLAGLGLVCDDRDEELPGDLVDSRIIMRENNDPIAMVMFK